SGAASVAARVPFGATVNGRIDRPGEVDRYAVSLPHGQGLLVDVHAAALGSWLDSVVTVFDARGESIAEDDDRGAAGTASGGLFAGARDSRLELGPQAAGDLVVGIADRFGEGGPEYAYRLTIGPPLGDFAVTLEPGARAPRSALGGRDSGAWNVR